MKVAQAAALEAKVIREKAELETRGVTRPGPPDNRPSLGMLSDPRVNDPPPPEPAVAA